MIIYNCKHDGDQFKITKFKHGEVESSYLCNHVDCTCPAGVRDTCRHRQMLPMFLEENLVNTNLFLNWDKRSITDFNGLPAIPPQRDDLAPQALTDRQCDPNTAALTDTTTLEQDSADVHEYIHQTKPATSGGWRRW